jgi:hypothetical protein
VREEDGKLKPDCSFVLRPTPGVPSVLHIRSFGFSFGRVWLLACLALAFGVCGVWCV